MARTYLSVLALTLISVHVTLQWGGNDGECDCQCGCRPALATNMDEDKPLRVAFSVGLTKPLNSGPRPELLVKFDHVWFNWGCHYKDGRFTAPVKGVYNFDFGGSSRRKRPIDLHLKAGDPEIDKATAYNYNTYYGATSTHIILALNKGDKVSVWLHKFRSMDGYKIPSAYFTGYLMWEIKK